MGGAHRPGAGGARTSGACSLEREQANLEIVSRLPPARGIAPRRWGYAVGRRDSRDSAADSSWITPVTVEDPAARAAGGLRHQLLTQAQVQVQAFSHVQVLHWHATQLQATGCLDSFMVSFLRWLDDGMSSMTITFVDCSSSRQPLETNCRLRSCRWPRHRPNGVLRPEAARGRRGAQKTRLCRPRCAAGVPRQPLGR